MMIELLLAVGIVLASSEEKPPCEDVPGCVKKCDGGDPVACVMAAVLAFQAKGESLEPKKIAEYARRGCEEEIPRGCTIQALFMVAGKDFPRDPSGGLKLFTWSCENGDPLACGGAAELLLSGDGVPVDARRALALHERACDEGLATSCIGAGELLLWGDDVPRDRTRAERRFQQACDGGELRGCTQVAILLWDDDGTRKKNARALALYEKACAGGEGRACSMIAHDLSFPNKPDKADPSAADAKYKQACELGDAGGCFSYYDDGRNDVGYLERACVIGHGLACVTLGQLRLRQTPPDKMEAAEAFELACIYPGSTYSDRKACFSIGQLLADASVERKRKSHHRLLEACNTPHRGRRNTAACRALSLYLTEGSLGIEDDRWGFRLMKEACEQAADQEACTLVAVFYREGIGVVPDPEESKRRLKKQCNEERYSDGCTVLGAQLILDQDYETAAKILELACSDRRGKACNLLGVLRWYGKGAKRDPAQAVKDFEKSCHRVANGDREGCANLAEVYEFGYVLRRDLEKAHELYGRACKRGSTFACYRLGALLREGIGVDANLDRAEAVLRTACEGASADGCRELVLLLRSKSGKSNVAEIEKFSRIAFEKSPELEKFGGSGLTSVGRLYEQGVGTKKDLGKALGYYTRACEEYDLPGCQAAATLLVSGGEIAIDRERAARYLDRVCEVGHKESCERAATVRKD